MLIHSLKPADQPVVHVDLPPNMLKGEFLFRMEGLSCPNTNISDISCRLPYIGKAAEVEKLLSAHFQNSKHESFDYELIYNRGEVSNMAGATTSQKWTLIKKLFIKEQGFQIHKQFAEDHRVDTVDICVHLKHPEFPNGIGFGILEDKSELSPEIGKRNNRLLSEMNAELYVFFLDFEIPGKDPIPLWKEEGIIPKNFCFIPSSQYLKPLKKALADFDLQIKNTWFHELMQDLKDDFIQNETRIEESEEIMRKMSVMAQEKTPKRVARPRKKKDATSTEEPDTTQIVVTDRPDKE